MLSVVGLSLGGVVYALIFSGALIYLDNHTDERSRGGVHQVFNFFYLGISALVGNSAAGLVAEKYTIDGIINFKAFWCFPGFISLVTLLLIIFIMKKDSPVLFKMKQTLPEST